LNCSISLIKIIIKTAIITFLFSFSILSQDQSITDTTLISDKPVFEMEKSPWGAVGRSAVLPGWGQYYNEDYWHIPIIWGFLAWFGYQWVENNNEYKTNKDLFIQNPNNTIYQRQRDFYRDQRDNFTIYIIITYLLNLVDAYVGAHLYDFTVEQDFYTKTPVLNFRYHF
jgi:hypothetical protein